ncbi:discoidin domain receptor [Clonorchis sinensis]|uniref:Discoidin domain receptor n=1 Tax=Clonorchis sinensis TaxID=79923 RepID=G7Y8U8_CLOSI|nr:discoidin domain receptor [Clonorchis sinensis]
MPEYASASLFSGNGSVQPSPGQPPLAGPASAKPLGPDCDKTKGSGETYCVPHQNGIHGHGSLWGPSQSQFPPRLDLLTTGTNITFSTVPGTNSDCHTGSLGSSGMYYLTNTTDSAQFDLNQIPVHDPSLHPSAMFLPFPSSTHFVPMHGLTLFPEQRVDVPGGVLKFPQNLFDTQRATADSEFSRFAASLNHSASGTNGTTDTTDGRRNTRLSVSVMFCLNPNCTKVDKYTHLPISLVFMEDSTESFVCGIQLNVLCEGRSIFQLTRDACRPISMWLALRIKSTVFFVDMIPDITEGITIEARTVGRVTHMMYVLKIALHIQPLTKSNVFNVQARTPCRYCLVSILRRPIITFNLGVVGSLPGSVNDQKRPVILACPDGAIIIEAGDSVEVTLELMVTIRNPRKGSKLRTVPFKVPGYRTGIEPRSTVVKAYTMYSLHFTSLVRHQFLPEDLLVPFLRFQDEEKNGCTDTYVSEKSDASHYRLACIQYTPVSSPAKMINDDTPTEQQLQLVHIQRICRLEQLLSCVRAGHCIYV